MDGADPLADRIERLEAAVQTLRADRDRGEVRARRVAVIDEAGQERVVIETSSGTGSVLVRVPGAPGRTTGIELHATPAEDGDGPILGVSILRDGDVEEVWPPP